MITFEFIKWKNFLSTGNMWTEIFLNTDKTSLIVGANGHGKSTILDALTFVLFGKPFRKVNKPMLVNSVNNKDCVVHVEFSAYGKSYKIIRGIKPAIFEIYVDGSLLNQDSASRDYQEYLEKFILKMNMKSFCQIVILGSASFTPFMQLSPADRRTIIEDLLDIQIFSVMSLLVKQRFQENKEKLEYTKLMLKSAEDKKSYVEKTLESLRKTNDDRLSELQRKHDEISQQKKDLLSKVKLLVSEKEQLEKDIADLSDLRIRNQEYVRTLSIWDTDLSRYKRELKFFEDHEDCPTCKQIIGSDIRNRNKESLEKQIKSIESDCKVSQHDQSLLLAEINEKETKSDRIQQIAGQMRIDKQRMMDIIEKIDDITNHMNKIKNSDQLVIDNEKELQGAETEIESLKRSFLFYTQEKTFIDTATNLLKDGGIKTKIIKQYVPIINKHVNKYLDKMGFFVNFNIDENFSEVIKSRYRDEFSYASFSEGEKTRIDLALMFTWRAIAKMKNSVNTNLLILDEILDGSLDANGTDEFLKIIQSLTDDTNTFIISHKSDTISDKFDKIYHFQKIKNFSRLV
jgi:DNA repair exonuclease SbcCD ATPase subunit